MRDGVGVTVGAWAWAWAWACVGWGSARGAHVQLQHAHGQRLEHELPQHARRAVRGHEQLQVAHAPHAWLGLGLGSGSGLGLGLGLGLALTGQLAQRRRHVGEHDQIEAEHAARQPGAQPQPQPGARSCSGLGSGSDTGAGVRFQAPGSRLQASGVRLQASGPGVRCQASCSGSGLEHGLGSGQGLEAWCCHRRAAGAGRPRCSPRPSGRAAG